MSSARTSIIAGLVQMTLGGLLLLDVLGILESAAYLPALMFAAVGVVFVYLFVRSREYWWAAIPGSVFLGLSAVVTATQLSAGGAAGALLFLFMAAGFAAVYLRGRANWWALIPCGVMFTLAVIAALPQQLQGMPAAAVLFLGMAATFGLLSLVPVLLPGRPEGPGRPGHPARAGRMKWPLVPAAVLGALGVAFALQATALLVAADFAIPGAMIIAGIALLAYAYRARHNGQHKTRGV